MYIQFEKVRLRTQGSLLPVIFLSKCERCKALVEAEDEDAHRDYHEEIDANFTACMEQAKRHVPEPRYG